jgi:hypothetical protein
MSSSSTRSRRWRSHAFGVALDGSFALAGCEESRAPAGLPRVSMELADRAVLRGRLPPASSPVSWRYDAAGHAIPEFVGHPRAGYVVEAPGFGVFHISRSGRHVSCAPARVSSWRWQRYLVGQVLPFATTLRGREPWHASAVSLDGGAVAIVGDSGQGKSSLAAELILCGAELVADDVLALELGADAVIAHPGPGLMSLRRATAGRMKPAELRSLGKRVGADAQALRLGVARRELPLPLAAVYLLRTAPPPKRVRLTAVPAPDPRELLGSTYNFALTAPARLIRQLEVCAAVARSVPVVVVSIPAGADHRAIAERLLRDASDRERVGS